MDRVGLRRGVNLHLIVGDQLKDVCAKFDVA